MDQQERQRIRDVYLDTNSQVETARITRHGGPHSWDNVQLAHAICNSKKRDVMAPPCGEKMEA